MYTRRVLVSHLAKWLRVGGLATTTGFRPHRFLTSTRPAAFSRVALGRWKKAATCSLALGEAARSQHPPCPPSLTHPPPIASAVTTVRSAPRLSCTKLPPSLLGLWGALSFAMGYCSRPPPPPRFYSSHGNPIITYSLDLPPAVRHWALWALLTFVLEFKTENTFVLCRNVFMKCRTTSQVFFSFSYWASKFL